ncbi:ATP-dependent helicase [Nostocoides australiense]
MTADVLDRFSPATQAWFRGSFPAPTPAQQGAWEAISSGKDALVVAPTGSGKTLSAFLWAIDGLVREPVPDDPLARCRVVYISPMKALAVDVERNLRAPLVGIGHAADRLGLPRPDVSVAVRSGDTPANERRAFAKRPSDILITTPESLFLLLTSNARDALAGVETVILDEVHAVAATKRGAHLAVSLERLDALLPKPAQRIGLSATVRPIEEVARFLSGGRPVEVVAPPSAKEWDLQVVVPVPDMGSLGEPTGDLAGAAAGPERRASIWPHVEERIVDLVEGERSTLVFANSRRLAERLTARLNEIWDERLLAAEQDASILAEDASLEAVEGMRSRPARTPAQVMAQAGGSAGAPPVLARAHHGSVSKEQRLDIEEALKAGRLPAVVATSSLELGIDMGSVDAVVQVESPPSVAAGLQRVGRAGHQVGAISRGVFFPKYRGDLVQTAVVVERMRAGAIEALAVPANPLDVLAQQVVAMTAMDTWEVSALHTLLRRAAPYAGLSRTVLESVLDMLAGRYPSEEFAELRPRITWDRLADTVIARKGGQHLAVTSGGTIPDRGLFGVFLASDGPGRRVGELDEEMVYESRVGDVFTLGTSSWRIEEITRDQVLVTPAPGEPGKLPFWKGETQGRPVELGQAVGSFVRELSGLTPKKALARASAAGLDPWAADNLLAYLGEQKEATGVVPSDTTIVVERFRDEIGDWRVAVHSPFGMPVHAPWALAIGARMRERFGVEVQAMAADDGIVLRLPDIEFDDGSDAGAELGELLFVHPDEVDALVTAQLPGSALFASRFRECAARALLLPRRRPDQRQPLWQQRQRAAQLLTVAANYPDFPIVLETVRECLQDVYDVPGLVDLMRSVAARRITTVDVHSTQPSPFARSLMFGYVAQYLYEGDSPLAERRAAALSLDPALLAELLGRGEALALRELLDVGAITTTSAQLQRLTPERAARNADEVTDLLRILGPLRRDDLASRSDPELAAILDATLTALVAQRRVIPVRIAGDERYAVAEDAGRLRDALGTALPVGLPAAFLEPVADPLGELVARYARTHTPFLLTDLAAEFGIGTAVAHDALRRLAAAGRIAEGEFLPAGAGTEFCDAEVLRLLRRRSLASLRAEVEAVDARQYARFLPGWQGVGSGRMRGSEGVLRVVEQLSGALLPASAIESLVLPARVTDYQPAFLDELMSAGDVLWQGHGSLPGDDGWVSLHLAESAPWTLHPAATDGADPKKTATESDSSASGPSLAGSADAVALREVFAAGGAHFFRGLVSAAEVDSDRDALDALWELVWRGEVTGDTFAPVRALLAGGRGAHKQRPKPAPRSTRYGRRGSLAGIPRSSGLARAGGMSPSGPPTAVGRWSLLPSIDLDPTTRTLTTAEVLLDRYGVLTRSIVAAEEVPGGFAGIYRVLSAAEETGRLRRGYFIESLGAAQFATAGVIDALRSAPADAPALVLAATDPANPYGAALPWPARPEAGGHQPGRKAGAVVVLVDGELILYVERGGKTMLSWPAADEATGEATGDATVQAAADALALAVRAGALGRLTVEKADGTSVLAAGNPVAEALARSGFTLTPRGLRLRR